MSTDRNLNQIAIPVTPDQVGLEARIFLGEILLETSEIHRIVLDDGTSPLFRPKPPAVDDIIAKWIEEANQSPKKKKTLSDDAKKGLYQVRLTNDY